MKSKLTFLTAIAFLSILFFVLITKTKNKSNIIFEKLGSCLEKKKTVFYGAFWCPSCRKQKRILGKTFKFVNYVECSTPDGKEQTKECQEKNIKAYPTWEFEDGSRKEGVIKLDELSKILDCKLN